MGARGTDTGTAALQTLLHEAHATEAGALVGLELCGEYAIGSRLRAAVALFAGAARACAAAATDGPGRHAPPLPPPLAIRARLANGRYGVEIDRHRAFGLDLYDRARETVLPLQDGGTITAQAHLELAWRCARASLAPCSGPTDVGPMDRIVRGASPLGVDPVPEATPELGVAPIPATPFGRLLGRRDRGTYAVVPVLATWSFTVFGLRAAGARRFVCVHRSSLERFLDLLDTGALDDVLAAHVRSPFAGRVLSTFAQTQHTGMWDAIGDPADLLPPEREPVAAPGRRTAPGGAKPARLGKPWASVRPMPAAGAGVRLTRSEGDPPPPTLMQSAGAGPPPAPPGPRRWSRPLAIALGALLLALLAGAAFATGIFDRNQDRVIETAPASTTTVVAATTTAAPTTVGPTTTGDLATTTTAPPAPPTTATVAPTTTAVTAITLPPPTSSIPATTAVATTVPATTAPEPTTTTLPPTTTVPPPTTVAVDNCTFTPTSLSRSQGSAVRFTNQSATATITLTVTGPPGSSDAFFSLEPGGTSGPYVLNVGGTYVFQCRGAGTGQVAITAT